MSMKSSAILSVVLFFAVCCAQAMADTVSPGPGFEVIGNATPTDLPPGGEGVLNLYVYNTGGAPAPAGTVVTDRLPEDLTATSGEYEFKFQGTADIPHTCVITSNESTVTCSLPEITTYGLEDLYEVHIHVKVKEGASGSQVNRVSVSNPAALPAADAQTSFPVALSASTAAPGFSNFDAWASNTDGTADTQAGSHPYGLTVAFAMNNTAVGEPFGEFGLRIEHVADGGMRSISVNLPPGIVGDPRAVPQCPRSLFDVEGCPADSMVGWNAANLQGFGLIALAPIYNLVPPSNVPAQFAFNISGVEVLIDAGVRTGGDNGITQHVADVPERSITFNTTTIWGVPGDPLHDPERCAISGGAECSTGIAPTPLVTLPTSCQGPQEYSIKMLGTWDDESITSEASSLTHNTEGTPAGFTGCEKLRPFVPAIDLAPDTSYSDTPAGLTVNVKMAEGLNKEGLGTPNLKNTTVVLPEGVVINPGQATGLVACQPSQEAFGDEPNGETKEGPVSCPSASKVGTDEITTPLLANKLEGNVYILGQNPPNLQLLVTASGEGVNLKLVGNVHLDENTGQLTTTFENTPDLPFTDFKLNFSGGAQAALATPVRCGTYSSNILFEPWAAPVVENAALNDKFEISAGPGGSACQWPLPFAPVMTAGATTDQAGGYTGFTMLLQRSDGQQRIERLQFKTPEGLLGMISKVQLCQEPQAASGECSSGAQIGHTVTTAGPGPYPFEVPQYNGPPAPIYLTGPYEGAPYGLSIVVPVVAGPFNLGTVVVRARIEVDPHTSELTITTHKLPLILDGIPTDLRAIDAVIDRPEFMFNPTDCSPMSFSGTAFSDEGATAPISTHFQVGSCQALKFQPNFKVSTNGRTTRKSGASLTAKIVYPVGSLGYNQASSQSNIQSVKVDLPKQLPSRLETLKHACPAATFDTNHAACPAASVVGHAKAITPLLPRPLEGPAYFVSHGGEAFPNLVVVLQGDNVTVELVGDTFINEKTNITSSTFKQVPDVPIQSFELTLPQGPYSALAANTNLCKVKGGLHMPTSFIGHNGASVKQNTPIAITGCAKQKAAKKARSKKGGKPTVPKPKRGGRR